jgi:hypothetical protein
MSMLGEKDEILSKQKKNQLSGSPVANVIGPSSPAI